MKRGVFRPLENQEKGGNMKKPTEQYFRVECNFGSKYFVDPERARAYFYRKVIKHLDVELWLINYWRYDKKKGFYATQELLAYSGTKFTKN